MTAWLEVLPAPLWRGRRGVGVVRAVPAARMKHDQHINLSGSRSKELG